MLVTDDKGVNKGEPAPPVKAPADGPPPYDPATLSAPQLPRTQTSSSSTSATSGPSPIPRSSTHSKPPNIPASNFMKIKRKNGSIKGAYVIDAGLQVPDEVLSGSAAPESSAASAVDRSLAETRKNLCIESTNGSISADVWLISDGAGDGQELDVRRAELDLKAQNGSVNVKLNSVATRPFVLNATAKNGSVSLALQSDFVGLVTLTAVNGSISLSDTMESRMMTFSEADGKRNCFIGDFRKANYTGRQNWTGSTVDVASHNGRVKLTLVDEEEPRSINGSGFLRRLFRS